MSTDSGGDSISVLYKKFNTLVKCPKIGQKALILQHFRVKHLGFAFACPKCSKIWKSEQMMNRSGGSTYYKLLNNHVCFQNGLRAVRVQQVDRKILQTFPDPKSTLGCKFLDKVSIKNKNFLPVSSNSN